MRVRRQGVTSRDVGGERVMLDLESSTYVRANPVATYLLDLLQEDRTRDDLLDAVLDRFDVSRERAETDIDGFLADLRSQGLLEEG